MCKTSRAPDPINAILRHLQSKKSRSNLPWLPSRENMSLQKGVMKSIRRQALRSKHMKGKGEKWDRRKLGRGSQIACDMKYIKTATPNQCHIETKVPAIQAEQVEADVAPVTAEYFPASVNSKDNG
jgi:hypothetical protein